MRSNYDMTVYKLYLCLALSFKKPILDQSRLTYPVVKNTDTLTSTRRILDVNQQVGDMFSGLGEWWPKGNCYRFLNERITWDTKTHNNNVNTQSLTSWENRMMDSMRVDKRVLASESPLEKSMACESTSTITLKEMPHSSRKFKPFT